MSTFAVREFDYDTDADWIIAEHEVDYKKDLELSEEGTTEFVDALTEHLKEIRSLQDSDGIDTKNCTSRMWILTQDSVPVGCVSLRTSLEPAWDAESEEEWVTRLSCLLIRSEYRGKGLVNKLLDKAAQVKATDGSNTIWLALGVHDEFKSAIKVYERYGFELFKTIEPVKFGRKCVFHTMYKEQDEED